MSLCWLDGYYTGRDFQANSIVLASTSFSRKHSLWFEVLQNVVGGGTCSPAIANYTTAIANYIHNYM